MDPFPPFVPLTADVHHGIHERRLREFRCVDSRRSNAGHDDVLVIREIVHLSQPHGVVEVVIRGVQEPVPDVSFEIVMTPKRLCVVKNRGY